MLGHLRALLFYVFGFSTIVPFALTILLLFWAPHTVRWKVCVAYCRLTLWAGEFFCGMKVVIEGRENLPDEACVVMIKHTTTLETYGHVPLFPRTSWVIKREITWMPIFGWAIALALRPIAIHRGAKASAVGQSGRRCGWQAAIPETGRRAVGAGEPGR